MSEVNSPQIESTTTGLAKLIQEAHPCHLDPLCFFVSWQGVLTLAYRGFPRALTDLKERIAAEHPALPKENPGSLWPKTTLAPLKDGQRLTPEQLQRLNNICLEQSLQLRRWHREPSYLRIFSENNWPHHWQVPVKSAAIAVFECRSLEKLLDLHEVEMEGEYDMSLCLVEPGESARVQNIVDEAKQPDYWFAASKDGSRESHYRGPALGCTLIVPVMAPENQELIHNAIAAFQRRIEEELPGMYAWLSQDSYHVTLRAIMG